MESTFISKDWTPRNNIITVIGVGGGGGNAVEHMHNQGVENVDFAICNTDMQALEAKDIPIKIQLGKLLTNGLGAGMDAVVGRKAAEESVEDIKKLFEGKIKMAFITCGMGGGTGTGAAPVVAAVAKKANMLTVGVVTLPFRDEGDDALYRAIEGIKELSHNVDSLLIIDNQKLYELYGDMNIFSGFAKADDVLCTAVRSIADVITKNGILNTDFNDVKKVMQNSGVALMGIGVGKGADRVDQAVNQALSSPLLNKLDLETAKNAIVNITTSPKEEEGITLDEMSRLMGMIQSQTGNSMTIKRGLVKDESMGDSISVTIIATGFEMSQLPTIARNRKNVIEVTFTEDASKYRKTGAPLCPEDEHIIRKAHVESIPSLLTGDPEKFALLNEESAFVRREKIISQQKAKQQNNTQEDE